MVQKAQYVGKYNSRSVSMGQNVKDLLVAMHDTKLAVWAHNAHIGVRGADGTNNLGSEMRTTLGTRYYAIGFEFDRGTVQVRPFAEQGSAGPLQKRDVAPAATGSLPWYLSQAHRSDFFVNLRTPPPSPSIEQWLAKPTVTHFVSWNHRRDEATTMQEPVGRHDGMVFVHASSRARPTRTALDVAVKSLLF